MLLGVLSGLAGNLWLDLGREDQATEFFDIGELAGHEAQDPDLTAWVLATRSIGPFFAGQHRDAVDLLARAEALPRCGPALGGAPGWLLCGLALPRRWEITT